MGEEERGADPVGRERDVGAVYTFTEKKPRAARVLYYQLEHVDRSGTATQHPAIEVAPVRGPSGSALRRRAGGRLE